MPKHSNHTHTGTPALTRNARRNDIQIEPRYAVNHSYEPVPEILPPARPGLFQQFLGLAQSLLPGQVARLTVTTLEVFGGSEPAMSEDSQIRPVPKTKVLQILERAFWMDELGCSWHHGREVTVYPDGTTIVVLKANMTGFREAWTVCPLTMTPKRLNGAGY